LKVFRGASSIYRPKPGGCLFQAKIPAHYTTMQCPLRQYSISRPGGSSNPSLKVQNGSVSARTLSICTTPTTTKAKRWKPAYPKLAELRDEGRIKAIGVGMNWVEPLERFAEEGEFDVFLLAGRYSLLEQTALDRLFPVMAEKGMSVVAGGVFNSGLLIDPRRGSMYDYAAAPDDVVVKAQRLAMVCGKFGVPLRAAALQFAAAHPLVASVIVGARTVAEIDDTLELCALAIPHELWTKLKEDELIRADAPVPGN
jgi:aryl-alcohol dehydrogenase-like predicted oxidoreductase